MKILVPLVSPLRFERVVNSLIERNRVESIEIRVVMIIPHLPARAKKNEETLNNSILGIVDKTVAALKNSLRHDRVSGKVLRGDTVSSIAQEAKDWNPDLIIMGARERNRFLKFLFEDNPEKLAKLVSCKIEVVKVA